jgi:hypothetical protein
MTARTTRIAVALLVAAPFAASPLRAQGVEYAAGTTRYRVTTTTKGSQMSPMGNAQFEVGLREQLTVNISKHAKDTIRAQVTLDSITLKSTGPSPDVSKLNGTKFVSLVSPTGKFYSTKPPEGVDPALGQVLEGVGRFLPAFRGNIAPGLSWADTSTAKVSQQGMDLDRTTVSNYTVTGDTTIGGEKAFRVKRTTSVKAAGSGSMQGNPVSMASTGTSNGAFFLTPKGVYLGGVSTDDVDLKITILAQNAEIIIKQNSTSKIEAIK